MTREEVLDEINVIYERLSHPEDCENGVYSFRDGNYLEALEVLIDYYEVGFIEELEKIKEEIDALYGVYYSYFKERLVIKSDVMRILDEHISELKGEQK